MTECDMMSQVSLDFFSRPIEIIHVDADNMIETEGRVPVNGSSMNR